jgi:hypothetical protein
VVFAVTRGVLSSSEMEGSGDSFSKSVVLVGNGKKGLRVVCGKEEEEVLRHGSHLRAH